MSIEMNSDEVRSLALAGEPLPDDLTVIGSLDLRGCTGLTSLPDGLTVGGSLYLGGCIGLTSLPDGLTVGGWLYLGDCTGLTSLPDGMTVGGWLDLGDRTGLTSVPERMTICGHPVVVPIVEDLDRKVADAVGESGDRLAMRAWHTCDTTHCRGGWAIHLAGEVGRVLEEQAGAETAATLIYVASAGYVPDFFASNEAALRDIQSRGK